MILPDDEFEAYVLRHEAMLCRIAFNFIRSASIAEEVVQDVFLQCYRNLAKIESPGHLAAWLRRAVTHRCIDVARSGRVQKELQLDELPDVAGPVSENDPLLSERLRRLVASLPEKQRIVVILRYAEDMDSEEIGEMLDMPRLSKSYRSGVAPTAEVAEARVAPAARTRTPLRVHAKRRWIPSEFPCSTRR